MELLAGMRSVEEQGQGSSEEERVGAGGLAVEVMGEKIVSLTCQLPPVPQGSLQVLQREAVGQRLGHGPALRAAGRPDFG